MLKLASHQLFTFLLAARAGQFPIRVPTAAAPLGATQIVASVPWPEVEGVSCYEP